jgi:RNA polymerase sigma factor (sigma-70 family)
LTEKQLISKCIGKDQRAMTELFNRYAHALKGTCRRILKHEDEASDVFQEGFIVIFNKLDTFGFKSSLYTWMNRVMVNTALSHVRKQNIIYSSIDINEMDIVEQEEDIEDGLFEYLEELDSHEILDLLNLLPDKYRIILGLFAVDGYKHTEISEKLGISVALSKKIVSRARMKLVEIVKNKQYEHRETGYTAAR